MIQMTIMRFMFDLKIGKRRMAAVAPVNNVIVPVNETFPVQVYKNFAYGS